MATPPYCQERQESRLKKFSETVRRAFVEFLRLPASIIIGFLLLAVVTSLLDFEHISWIEPVRAGIKRHLFSNAQATSGLLATIAGSIITVTSITFSLLLLAVQQAAGALTHMVYDQFLRRMANQVYFGFFVGLAVYTLVILATVNPPYNPVLGATLALLLTVVALMLMILLLYTTVNQMRPVVVIETIHDHVMTARACQLNLLARSRRTAQQDATLATPVQARIHGYVVRVNLDILAQAIAQAQGKVEIVMLVSIGHYVAFEDALATVWTAAQQDATAIASAVQQAVCLEQQRDLDNDPAYGIEQLAIIGWSSISTAKSNPSPGILVLHSLRDLLARWSAEQPADKAAAADKETLPVVYVDNVFAKLLDAFENLAVAASESMQPQTMTEFVRTFAIMFGRMSAEQQPRAEDLIRRSLSFLGEHVLTAPLSDALSDLKVALEVAGRRHTAAEVHAAHMMLSASVGKLGSRATRTPQPRH